MNKELCRYCRKRAAVLDGLCRLCWETLSELLITGSSTGQSVGDACPNC
jgi:hypothetical protein